MSPAAVRPVLAFALASIALGCVSTADGARAAFVEANACPEERVSVRDRPDLDAAALVAPDVLAPRPVPADVAADPARMRLFCDLEAERRERVSRAYAGHDVFEVAGCGRAALLACAHPSGRNGATRLDRVLCREVTPRAAPAPTSPGCPAR